MEIGIRQDAKEESQDEAEALKEEKAPTAGASTSVPMVVELAEASSESTGGMLVVQLEMCFAGGFGRYTLRTEPPQLLSQTGEEQGSDLKQERRINTQSTT